MIKKDFTLISLLLVGYLLSIWWGYLEYYWVQTPDVVPETKIQGMRFEPNNQVLDLMLENDEWVLKLEVSISASKSDVLRSITDHDSFNNENRIRFFPFDPSQLAIGNSSLRLSTNSLSIPQLLLEYYESTKDSSYLQMAVDYTLSFSRYDRGENFNDSFLNNDHAVAARAYVLSKLWRHYRQSGKYEQGVGEEIISYVQFIGSRLGKRSFYTYKTNHGTMQNTGLMLLATVFPEMPDSRSWAALGKQRLEEQIDYLVSSEGFYLEHSFEYHELFVALLTAAKKYSTVNPDLSSQLIDTALSHTKSISAFFQRSDGTIAAIGDTSYKTKIQLSDKLRNHKKLDYVNMFPESGISFLHQKDDSLCLNNDSYLTVSWSNFLNHGHKRWNDGMVDVFICNTQWWRAAGYVPYWHPLRKSAERWFGANAPHLIGEPAPQSGGVKDIWQVNEKNLQYIRIRREPNKSYSVEREVYQLGGIVIVADFLVSEAKESLEVFWTMSADKLTKKIKSNYFKFQDANNKSWLYAYFSSSGPFSINHIRASKDSVLGWVEEDKKLRSASTMVLKSEPSNEVVLLNTSIVLPGSEGNCTPRVEASFGRNIYDRLEVKIKNCGLDYVLRRDEWGIKIQKDQSVTEYSIQKIDGGYISGVEKIEKKTEAVFEKYGERFEPLYPYRLKVTLFGGGVFLFCVVLIYMAHRIGNHGLLLGCRYVSFSVLALLVIWIQFFYFSS